jgi:hypothetical protein
VRNLVHKIVHQFYAFSYLFTPHVVCSIYPRFVPGLCSTILSWMGLLEVTALCLGSCGFSLGQGPVLLVGPPLERLVLRGGGVQSV